MKKLMILGAIAAATVGYGAEASYLAQVYDVSITMKTGVCRAGKATAATVKYYEAYLGKDNAPFAKGEEMGFRRQATRKITGVIWGCDCETIAVPAWRAYRANGAYNLGGYAFWDQTARTFFVLPNTRFTWNCLNRITADFKTVEGSWRLANNVNRQAMSLTGAGFGKASIASLPCRSIVSKISGSFAGFRLPGLDDLVSNCPYCGVGACVVRPFCELCCFWTSSRTLTAAYGSWSIKFNKNASTRLARTTRITQSYTFRNAGNLQGVLVNMENAVRLLGARGWLNANAIQCLDLTNNRTAILLTRLQVQIAYIYGLAPLAVNIGNAAITINWNTFFATLAADEDADLDMDEAVTEINDLSEEDEDTSLELEAYYLGLVGYARIDEDDLIDLADDEYPVYDDDSDEDSCKKCGSTENNAKNTMENFIDELNAFVDAS